MKILPISQTNYINNKSVKFEKKPQSYIANVAKKVFLPTSVALSMLTTPVAFSQENKIKQVETENYDETMPHYIQDESIRYFQDFKMDGKNYTMFYTDYCQKFSDREGAVVDIYFVPEDFKLHKKGNEELNSPLKLEKMVHHVFDNSEKDFVSVVVSESSCDKNGENFKHITKQIRLPKEVGDSLLALYQGKTEFYLLPGFNTYNESDRGDLGKTRIQYGKKSVSIK